jgi:hypothetical protein
MFLLIESLDLTEDDNKSFLLIKNMVYKAYVDDRELLTTSDVLNNPYYHFNEVVVKLTESKVEFLLESEFKRSMELLKNQSLEIAGNKILNNHEKYLAFGKLRMDSVQELDLRLKWILSSRDEILSSIYKKSVVNIIKIKELFEDLNSDISLRIPLETLNKFYVLYNYGDKDLSLSERFLNKFYLESNETNVNVSEEKAVVSLEDLSENKFKRFISTKDYLPEYHYSSISDKTKSMLNRYFDLIETPEKYQEFINSTEFLTLVTDSISEIIRDYIIFASSHYENLIDGRFQHLSDLYYPGMTDEKLVIYIDEKIRYANAEIALILQKYYSVIRTILDEKSLEKIFNDIAKDFENYSEHVLTSKKEIFTIEDIKNLDKYKLAFDEFYRNYITLYRHFNVNLVLESSIKIGLKIPNNLSVYPVDGFNLCDIVDKDLDSNYKKSRLAIADSLNNSPNPYNWRGAELPKYRGLIDKYQEEVKIQGYKVNKVKRFFKSLINGNNNSVESSVGIDAVKNENKSKELVAFSVDKNNSSNNNNFIRKNTELADSLLRENRPKNNTYIKTQEPSLIAGPSGKSNPVRGLLERDNTNNNFNNKQIIRKSFIETDNALNNSSDFNKFNYNSFVKFIANNSMILWLLKFTLIFRLILVILTHYQILLPILTIILILFLSYALIVCCQIRNKKDILSCPGLEQSKGGINMFYTKYSDLISISQGSSNNFTKSALPLFIISFNENFQLAEINGGLKEAAFVIAIIILILLKIYLMYRIIKSLIYFKENYKLVLKSN